MTSEESFAKLREIESRKYPDELKDRAEYRAATSEEERREIANRRNRWYQQKEADRLQAIHDLVPAVGTPCTIIYYSDRRAATVSEIVSPTKIKVKHNKTKCLDYYAGEYEILPELEDCMGEDTFTKRKNGQWVEEGHPVNDGVLLALSFQRHYIDPCF